MQILSEREEEEGLERQGQGLQALAMALGSIALAYLAIFRQTSTPQNSGAGLRAGQKFA